MLRKRNLNASGAGWAWAGCVMGSMVLAGGLTGCASDGQAGGLIGAGIGALAGQAIGGNTEGTLIGTAIGAGAGYVIGNESDKGKARRGDYSDW